MTPLEPRHAAELYEGLADPELYRFVPGDPPATVEALEARYRRTAAGPSSSSERWYNWAVALREGAAGAFGTVEITIVEGGAKALLAYSLARNRWGRGYAVEACSAALDFLRASTPVLEISAFVDTRNERSIALLERLGFTREARIEHADHFKGSTSDEHRYRLALGAKSVLETLKMP